MDADQPQNNKDSAHDGFIIIINLIFNNKSLLEHVQCAASGPLAYICFLTDSDARLSDVMIWNRKHVWRNNLTPNKSWKKDALQLNLVSKT